MDRDEGRGRGEETFAVLPALPASELAVDVRIALLGAWYDGAEARVRAGYHDWYDPIVDDVAAALLGPGQPHEALRRFGAARARAGWDIEDVLAEWSSLAEALPERNRERLDDQRAIAAIVTGHEAVEPGGEPPSTGFDGPLGLRERLVELYHRYRLAGGHPGEGSVLLLVEASLAGPTAPRGVVVHAVAEHLHRHFPSVGVVSWLGEARFALLAHRHPGLAVAVEHLEAALVSAPELAGATLSIWVAPLPEDETHVAGFVDRLSSLPAQAWLATHGTAAEASRRTLIDELADSPRPVTPLRPEPVAMRTRRALAAAWDNGLSLVAAAAVVVLLAAGLVHVVGPLDRDGVGGAAASAPSPPTAAQPRLAGGPSPVPPPIEAEALAVHERSGGAIEGEPAREDAEPEAVEPPPSDDGSGAPPAPEPTPAPPPEPRSGGSEQPSGGGSSPQPESTAQSEPERLPSQAEADPPPHSKAGGDGAPGSGGGEQPSSSGSNRPDDPPGQQGRS